jgi:DNA-directed RNA polymerase subunit M/transcription elongation factor TFIIS
MEDTTFCDDCGNLMYLFKDENESLINMCKACNNKSPIDETFKCCYRGNLKIDKTVLLSTNKYISHDRTLPSIESNVNIQCNSPECDNKNSILYIKYNDDDMKYLYICKNCGNTWNNNI